MSYLQIIVAAAIIVMSLILYGIILFAEYEKNIKRRKDK